MLPSRSFATTIVAALLALLSAQNVFAAFGISSASGVTVASAPLPSVQPGVSEAGLPVIFPEVLGGQVISLAGLPVDHDGSSVIASPTISGNVVNPALIATTLPAGVAFNSYLFHFDPVGAPFFAFYNSTITFDQPIIGVQLFSNGFPLEKPSSVAYTGTLEAGDAEVILNGGPIGVPSLLRPFYYPGGIGSRGLEEDSFILAISGQTMTIAGGANGPEIDEVRVLTAVPLTAVPEAGAVISWMAIAFTCGCIYSWRRSIAGLVT